MFGIILPCPRAPGPIRYRWPVPLQDMFTLHQGPPTGIHGNLRKPPHLHGAGSCLALSLLHSHPGPCPTACCPVFFLPQGRASFLALQYTLVAMRLPCFTLQPAAVQTIPLWEEREGSQRFALSFLTQLRPRRAGVLQNECHHFKEVTVVGAGVGVTSQLHTITGSPVSENSTAQNSYPGQRRLQPPSPKPHTGFAGFSLEVPAPPASSKYSS